MSRIKFLKLFLVLSISSSYSQNLGTIKGKLIEAQTREPLAFASVVVYGLSIGTTSNDDGTFEITNVPLGYQKVQASFVGYESIRSEDFLVTRDTSPFIELTLKPANESLNEVTIQQKFYNKSIENVISAQKLGIKEIEKTPGGNRDIIKVAQILPGVASTPGFRNELIVRGGSPSENKFYLDGIEIPIINHFQTQGSTGGPVGIINADLIRSVDFYSGNFPVQYSNALSSVIEFKQKQGHPEEFNTRLTLGSSDFGISANGPLGDKTTFSASYRRSYLQFLFKALKLPFLPTYNDFQLYVTHKPSPEHSISFIGIAAIDDFVLNNEANEGVEDEETIKRNDYILSVIPENQQNNYTIGLSYKHFGEKATQHWVLSQSRLLNKAYKYQGNIESDENLLLDYTSKETETKLRFVNTFSKDKRKFLLGAGLESGSYMSDTYSKFANANGVAEYNFNSELKLLKYSAFLQYSNSFYNDKLGVVFGLRFDGTNYTKSMENLLKQAAPKLVITYKWNDQWSFTNSAAIYHQLPANTILGYREGETLINKENDLKYIKSTHYVSGLTYLSPKETSLSLEGFYKNYSQYPFSIQKQISLANLGGDFGVIGNEEVVSTSKGRTYGLEFLVRKQIMSGLFGLLSYTYVVSEFQDASGNFIPSSWDNKHLISALAGIKLKKNWELGFKFRYLGAKPYTPYNKEASALIQNYDIENKGILDFTQLNSERLEAYHQLDFRLDKTWYFKKLALNLYLDVVNLYNRKVDSESYLIPIKDENGNRVIDPADPSRYSLEEVNNKSGSILPSIGVVIDF